jgi:hypothetical protein
MHLLSSPELQTLREFLVGCLSIGFIRPTSSSHGAPVLFPKEKDSPLRLCVDFHGLNHITTHSQGHPWNLNCKCRMAYARTPRNEAGLLDDVGIHPKGEIVTTV